VGFFDHMLTLLAKHSAMDLVIHAVGDEPIGQLAHVPTQQDGADAQAMIEAMDRQIGLLFEGVARAH